MEQARLTTPEYRVTKVKTHLEILILPLERSS